MWDKHGGAVITGATAIVASALAAWFTSGSTRDVVQAETRRAAETRAEDAQGAARVLMGEFLVASEELADWVANGTMEPLGPDFAVAIRQADLGLIAARVSPHRWNAISRGLSTVQSMRRYVLNRTDEPNRFTGKFVSRNIVYMVARDLDAIRRASLALAGVARVGDEVPGTTIDPAVVFRDLQRKSRMYGIRIAED